MDASLLLVGKVMIKTPFSSHSLSCIYTALTAGNTNTVVMSYLIYLYM